MVWVLEVEKDGAWKDTNQLAWDKERADELVERAKEGNAEGHYRLHYYAAGGYDFRRSTS